MPYCFIEERCFGLESILVAASKEPALRSLTELLRTNNYQDVVCAENGEEVRSLCSVRDFSAVIINVPLSDESGEKIAAEILKNSTASVMLIVGEEHEAHAESVITGLGGIVITKPLNRVLFSKAVKLAVAMNIRLSGVRRENVMLQKKMEDVRIINRAKAILMEYLSMSESQAHKYLEKQSMDLRLPKVEVAKNLLSTYDS